MTIHNSYNIFVLVCLIVGNSFTPMPTVDTQALKNIGKDTHFRALIIPLAPTATYTVCASGCDFSGIQAAIDAANNGDVIDLASETYTETITIDKSIDLIGEGAENTIIQAAGEPDIASSRVITVTEEVSVTIQGITVRFGVSDYGGGIYNHGVLTLSGTKVISNTAVNDGGGLYNDGKFLFHSVLTVTNSTITGNNALRGGGIYNLAGVVNLEDLTIANNAASSGLTRTGGGGIHNLDGEIFLSDLTITDNSALNGGGIFNHALDQSATIRINNSTISSNYAIYGGGIHNYGEGDIAQSVITQSLFITNTVHYPVGVGGGIFNTSAPGGIGKLQVLESVFSDNRGSLYGGGIAGGLNAWGYDQTGMLELDVSDTLFSNNNAITGGGIAAVSEGDNPGLATVSVHNGTFSDNQAEIGGGAIFLFSNKMMADKSTFVGNIVTRGGGGAIFTASSGKGNPTILSISNSTFSNNTSSLYDGGGAILNNSLVLGEIGGVSLLNIDTSTFADNNTDQEGVSIANYSEGISSTAILTLTNTILADDAMMSSCHNEGGTIIDGGFNHIADGSCGFPVGGDPLLAPLADNGGDTQTHALYPRSPAIDAIPVGECSLATDQRGVPRPQRDGCDIGAFEAEANIIHVDQDATGTASGLSWTDAFTNVQDALSVAVALDDIWVAKGVYFPDEGVGQINDVVTSTFTLTDSVRIYGGFDPGSGADEFSERDWENYVTVLSGDLEQNDITDPNGVVTDTGNITGTNVYHVVSSIGVTDTTGISGFWITAGFANGEYSGICGQVCGGGIHIEQSYLTLSDLMVIGNYAIIGGGVYNEYGLPSLRNITVTNNTAGEGGGIYNVFSNMNLENLTISGNYGDHGGGMSNAISDPTLMNVQFVENQGTFGGGMLNGNSAPFLSGAEFTRNQATVGGGMFNSGGSPILNQVVFLENISHGAGAGIANDNNSSPRLTDVTFVGNFSYQIGGGIYNRNESKPTLTNVTFDSNSAGDYGGAIYNRNQTNLNVSGSVFINNTAGEAGGGLYNETPDSSVGITNTLFFQNSADDGGGIHASGNDYKLVNVTMAGNTATNGGAIYNSGELDLTNLILWGNNASGAGDQIYNVADLPLISHSDIQGSGGSGAGWDTGLGIDVGGNLDADPLFLGEQSGDFHLRSGSPVIDSGTNMGCPAFDLDGKPRPVGLACDMGAYETHSISLYKQVDNPIPVPGEKITFTIRVGNTTTETLSGGLISDSLPAGLNFIGSIQLDPPTSGTLGFAPPELVTDLTIPPNQMITVTFPVTVSYGLAAGTQLVNTAAFSSSKVTIPVQSSITLTVQNAAPIATADVGSGFSTNKDTAFTTVSVLINDRDPNGDYLFVESFETSGTLGTVTHLGSGIFSYDPDGQFDHLSYGQQATDIFSYTISDGVLTDTAVVTITIAGLQDNFYIYLPLAAR